LMNEWVRSNSDVVTQEMSIDEAKATGAIAMFGEKYGDVVRVVKMGDFSLEFCGGTHVANTAEIGQIKIISEGSVAQGTRRIEAYSGPRAWNFIADQLKYLGDATDKLKVKPAEMVAQIERLQSDLRAKEKALQMLEEKLALSRVADIVAKAEKVGSTSIIACVIPELSGQSLKLIAESIKANHANTLCLLASSQGDTVSLVVAASPELVKQGFKSGKAVGEVAAIVGGKGGGRDEIAAAGGKEPAKINEAIARFRNIVAEQLGATGKK